AGPAETRDDWTGLAGVTAERSTTVGSLKERAASAESGSRLGSDASRWAAAEAVRSMSSWSRPGETTEGDIAPAALATGDDGTIERAIARPVISAASMPARMIGSSIRRGRGRREAMSRASAGGLAGSVAPWSGRARDDGASCHSQSGWVLRSAVRSWSVAGAGRLGDGGSQVRLERRGPRSLARHDVRRHLDRLIGRGIRDVRSGAVVDGRSEALIRRPVAFVVGVEAN